MATLRTPERPQTSSTLKFYGDEFVFDTVSGMFYRLNPTACFILRALDSGTAIDALPALLEKQYGLDRATALRDVALFLNDLAALEPLNLFSAGDRAVA
jgi:hypothetical protein